MLWYVQPFDKAEVDRPSGFIKIEPPFDPSTLAEPDKLNLSAEKKEKTSVKDKLEAKKKESKTQINHRIRENKRQS